MGHPMNKILLIGTPIAYANCFPFSRLQVPSEYIEIIHARIILHLKEDLYFDTQVLIQKRNKQHLSKKHPAINS